MGLADGCNVGLLLIAVQDTMLKQCAMCDVKLTDIRPTTRLFPRNCKLWQLRLAVDIGCLTTVRNFMEVGFSRNTLHNHIR